MKRKPVSKRTRFDILARDKFTCRYCGRQGDSVILVVDHVIPVAQGGTNDPENLVTACEDCNQGKAAKTPTQAAPTEADRRRIANARRRQIRAFRLAREAAAARQGHRQEMVDEWCAIRHTEDADGSTISVMVRYAEEYGAATVFEWIQKAHDKHPGWPDYKIGKYVSGIRLGIHGQRTA